MSAARSDTGGFGNLTVTRLPVTIFVNFIRPAVCLVAEGRPSSHRQHVYHDLKLKRSGRIGLVVNQDWCRANHLNAWVGALRVASIGALLTRLLQVENHAFRKRIANPHVGGSGRPAVLHSRVHRILRIHFGQAEITCRIRYCVGRNGHAVTPVFTTSICEECDRGIECPALNRWLWRHLYIN